MSSDQPTPRHLGSALLAVTIFAAACGAPQPPLERPEPAPPPAPEVTRSEPPPSPAPPPRPVPVPPEPIIEDSLSSKTLDELNTDSPLRAAFFDYDRAELTPEGQGALDANAAVLSRYPTWTVTIEGHTDERGTAEYNLALGERRAAMARGYLISLGIAAERLRTISYGKEFPFDPGHDEAAWATNRRAHFVITAR